MRATPRSAFGTRLPMKCSAEKDFGGYGEELHEFTTNSVAAISTSNTSLGEDDEISTNLGNVKIIDVLILDG